MNKLRIATIGVLAISLLTPSVVLAQEESPEHPENVIRAAGEITGVVPGQGTFTLMTLRGEELEFQTNEQTKFRGPDGSIDSIHDLKKGMKAAVGASEQADGTLLAHFVAAGLPEDLPDGWRAAGVIQSVDADNQSFAIETREGETVSFQTSERTRYHSRDGSIQELHDLKVGMMAMVGAIRQDDGQLLALVVGAGNPGDRPELDVRAGGEVVAKDNRSFAIQTRDGDRLFFAVDEDTHYKGISGFDDLKVGMMAAVGAVETDEGLLALFVGARSAGDRPGRGPQDRPGPGPGPKAPGPKGPGPNHGQEEDVSV